MAYPAKVFKTLSQQYDILTKKRKLTEQKLNQEEVEKKLLHYGYFDIINGFETLLLKDRNDKDKGFITDNFEDFLSLYEFDLLLKKEIFYSVSQFEIKLKNIVCYEFTYRYCKTLGTTLEYMNKSNYEDPRTHYNLNRHSFVVKLYNNDKFILFKQDYVISYDRGTDTKIRGNYAKYCQNHFEYASHYDKPPLWTVIKSLDLGSLLLMVQLLNKDTMDGVLDNYNLSSSDAPKFISTIEIIKSLRNSTAHFNLVNRFRTEGSININAALISELHLNPLSQTHRIKLFDTLKVLGQHEDITNIKKVIINYYDKKKSIKKEEQANLLLDRMGNGSIHEWKKL